MPYLIDSDVFIQAKNRHYGLDFCPAFWDWLVAENAAGNVFSVQRIGGELTAGNDNLATWASALGAGFFLRPDPAVAASMTTLSAWVTQPLNGYTPAAIAAFLASGEYHLIAHAHALGNGYSVVSHEVAANSPNKVKVPNACVGIGVTCIDPFSMLRNGGASFVLP